MLRCWKQSYKKQRSRSKIIWSFFCLQSKSLILCTTSKMDAPKKKQYERFRNLVNVSTSFLNCFLSPEPFLIFTNPGWRWNAHEALEMDDLLRWFICLFVRYILNLLYSPKSSSCYFGTLGDPGFSVGCHLSSRAWKRCLPLGSLGQSLPWRCSRAHNSTSSIICA